ncbi:M1 family aminopeptidase [Adhaeribacter aquaticus]|uniref:M1 family aminopeptidase n=1 Tax=Adhaeribacter aquaticus TaxID=299567 RepID=UPI00041B943F|nr:M1 family aminopeptidase [Adhaeribacter aquaticus]
MSYKHFSILSCLIISIAYSGCRINKISPTQTSDKSTIGIETADFSAADSVAEEDSIPDWISKKGPYRPAATRLHDLIHTKLRVSFDLQKQYLLGEATLTLKPYFYPQDKLILDAKGMDIHRVRLVSNNTEKELKYIYDKRVLTITLDKIYTRNDTYQVFIEYTAKPNELEAGGSAAITSDKGLYFIDPLNTDPNRPQQIWTQGETESNSAWFPTIDKPNERMTQEIYITVDPKFTTLSNGTLQYSRTNKNGTRTDYWKLDKPHAPYLAMLAVGEFAVVKDKWRNLDVNYYVEPQYKNTAKAVFGNTPAMMEFFSQKLGVVFPWNKYAQIVVRNFVSGAMENTTASVFMEDVQVDRRGLLDANWDYIIAHELFHQWFGDLVTLESWANLPLNESFANYAEYLWEEHKNGKMAADAAGEKELQQYLAESESKQEPLIRYHYQNKEDMFDSHSYAKGGRVLHMLRNYISDDAFFTALKNYLTQHKFTSVEVAELRMAFEEVTGEDLNWFFDQWFMSPGHPHLQVEHRYQNGMLTVTVTQLQDSAYTPVYRLPLSVSVWINNKRTNFPITLTKARETFAFEVPASPQLVLFDGAQQLLGVVSHPKSDAELLFQFHNSGQYVPKYEALQKLKEKVSDPQVANMYKSALKDNYWQIRSDALTALEKVADPELRTLVQNLAVKDENSSVRSEAINTLATFGQAEYTTVFSKGLTDSSYAVVGAAIEALTTTKNGNFINQMQAFENYTNGKVLASVANYYAFFGDQSKYNWYLNTLDKIHGENLFFFLQAFGGYLMKVPPAEQKPAIAKLEQLARHHKTYYVRLGAYQALTLAGDRQELEQIKEDIKKNEKDPKLINIYKNISY